MYNNVFLIWISSFFLSLSCSILGCLIVWRRIASFGNTLSHASLLGIALSLLLNQNIFYTVLFLVLILTVIITYIEFISNLSLDIILGVITYSSLSLGMMILNIINKNKHADLTKYLFGDLLRIKFFDFLIIVFITAILLLIVFFFWKQMISILINVELAHIHGINIFKIRLIFMIITAILIGVSTKIIGALLITALLIIPSATMQKFASSPQEMVIFAIIMNMICITFSIILSIIYIIPISPLIILIESTIFFISLIL